VKLLGSSQVANRHLSIASLFSDEKEKKSNKEYIQNNLEISE
jgi:hypothetical protein